MIAPVSDLERTSYPATLAKYIKKYSDDFGYEPTGEDAPTESMPGSDERIQVMRYRIENGLSLFSPEDRMPDEYRPRVDRWDDTVYRGNETCGAIFSTDDNYRYQLWRYWCDDRDRPVACFIGLNPSTATENQLDPTLRRIKGFAQRWGCRGFIMTNLFAYRATDPKQMKRADEPVGTNNDRAIADAVESASYVVCCWGGDGGHLSRSARVISSVKSRVGSSRIHCFGLTKKRPSGLEEGKMVGQPVHPLYLRQDAVTINLPFAEVDDHDKAVV